MMVTKYEKTAKAVIYELMHRKGFQHMWETTEPDIQEEMENAVVMILEEHLPL